MAAKRTCKILASSSVQLVVTFMETLEIPNELPDSNICAEKRNPRLFPTFVAFASLGCVHGTNLDTVSFGLKELLSHVVGRCLMES